MLFKERRSRFALALLAATCLTPAGPAEACPAPQGDEFQVNTFTTGGQYRPDVAMDADGNFVVAWEDYGGQDGSGRGIFAQRFDATGVAQGSEFQVNSFTTGGQSRPTIAMHADGDFVVAWEDYSGRDGDGPGVFAQRFNAAAVAQGPEFQVNSFTTGSQNRPAVAMDADGGFVVAWVDYSRDGDGPGVFAQRFNAAAVAEGPDFQVNSFTTGFQIRPAVAMDADGDFVVAWVDYGGQDGSGSGIFAQRFDARGVAQGPEFQVNSFSTGGQIRPAVAMDPDGNFVVAWKSGGQDGDDYGIFAQRFNAAGVDQGSEFQVNSFTTGGQGWPAIAMDTGGGFIVAWESASDVFAQRFNASGLAEGPEFQVNSFATGGQGRPTAAMGADGSFVVAWQDYYGQDGSILGVFARRYSAQPGPARGDFDADLRSDILWRKPGTGQNRLWQMDGFVMTANEPTGFASTDWRVKGLGDFNGDGKTDVLWRNASTGGTVIWEMDGSTVTASQTIGGVVLDWTVAGLGDFDGDGKADILWHRTATGKAVIWQMHGFSVTASQTIGVVPLAWKVAGLGDLNGDTKTDILWRDTTRGDTIAWLMDGFVQKDARSIGEVDLAWQLTDLDDFDGDTLSDLLWRNTATGGAAIWQMHGFHRHPVERIGAADLVWDVAGLGDFDGDCRADILWRNTTNGANRIWQMNGFTVSANEPIDPVPLVWEVQ